MPGEGAIEVAAGGAVTRLVASPPLALLNPRNHGRAAWIVAGSLGGGLVDGDRLRLDVRVAAGAALYLGTQSSTKVYAGPTGGSQELDAVVGGLLMSLPDPVVPYEGARYRQRARVRLEEGGSLVWLETLSAGRSARGERWAFARHDSRLRVERAGRPIVHDAVLLDPAQGDLGARLGRFEALATLVAVGPEVGALRDAWLAEAPLARDAPVRRAPSPLGDDGVIVRLAATSMQEMLRALREIVRPCAALLGDDPFARKW